MIKALLIMGAVAMMSAPAPTTHTTEYMVSHPERIEIAQVVNSEQIADDLYLTKFQFADGNASYAFSDCEETTGRLAVLKMRDMSVEEEDDALVDYKLF